MKRARKSGYECLFVAAQCIIVLASVLLFVPRSVAQNPQLQERLAEVKQAAAKNKQALAHYTWMEQDTISIKGEDKKNQVYQVRLGPDGKPQKTAINTGAPPESSSGGGGRQGRLKQKVVEKKKGEFKEYGQEMASLVHQYAPPDPQRLQEAFQKGNVTLGPTGAPNEVRLVIQNYYKPKDSLTLVFNKEQMAIQSVQVASYLDDPSDAVTLSAQFSPLPDGTNHVDKAQVNGVKKKLTVTIQNSNYQKM
jgi:hypothetical protein